MLENNITNLLKNIVDENGLYLHNPPSEDLRLKVNAVDEAHMADFKKMKQDSIERKRAGKEVSLSGENSQDIWRTQDASNISSLKKTKPAKSNLKKTNAIPLQSMIYRHRIHPRPIRPNPQRLNRKRQMQILLQSRNLPKKPAIQIQERKCLHKKSRIRQINRGQYLGRM